MLNSSSDHSTEQLKHRLEQHGFEAWLTADAEDLARALEEAPADLVVLDLDGAGESGLELCRRLACGHGPRIILLAAAPSVEGKIAGLEAGADDYLAKPCNPRELIARIRAVLRSRPEPPPVRLPIRRAFSGWILDMVARELQTPDGAPVRLSGAEFRLLQGMMERPHRVLSRPQLVALASGPGSDVSDQGVDVQISRLRRKLHDQSRRMIRTIRSRGYMFTAEVG